MCLSFDYIHTFCILHSWKLGYSGGSDCCEHSSETEWIQLGRWQAQSDAEYWDEVWCLSISHTKIAITSPDTFLVNLINTHVFTQSLTIPAKRRNLANQKLCITLSLSFEWTVAVWAHDYRAICILSTGGSWLHGFIFKLLIILVELHVIILSCLCYYVRPFYFAGPRGSWEANLHIMQIQISMLHL